MRIHSERAAELDAYINSDPSPKAGEAKIEIGGVPQKLPYYRFPLYLLRYNVENGRLAMEVREWEQTHGRKLEVEHKGDAEIIRGMLLDLDPAKTEALKDDLHKIGQLDPGVITHDGSIINGNRRMAILEALDQEEATGKWPYLEAFRLPSTVGQKDLWRIEAGLQLSKDKVAEYHPMNELLKIKQGIDAKLRPEEIAAAMYGRTVEEVNEALERLKLIDNFLGFWGQPENYGFIKKFGLHEYFIDLQKHIVAQWDKRSLNSKERNKELTAAFALIGASVRIQDPTGKKKKRKEGITHWDFRRLGKIYLDGRAKDTYLEHLGEAKKSKDILSIPPEVIIENFRQADEILKNKEDRDKPLLLIERAINALESIDETSEHLTGAHIQEAVQRLVQLTQRLDQRVNKKSTTHS